MNDQSINGASTPSRVISALILVVSATLMWYLRLHFYSDRFVTLTYGLPLLVCLWHRDRRLLWSMSAVFTVMAVYKAVVLLPSSIPDTGERTAQSVMHVLNVLVIAVSVDMVLRVTSRLHSKNAELEKLNHELVAREEEISSQNEEIQQQSEEVGQQAEELQAQAEELQALNAEAAKRQRMLQVLVQSTVGGDTDQELLTRICQSLLELFGDAAEASSILEQQGERVTMLARAGMEGLAGSALDFDRSFAAIVMTKDRTAAIDDLSKRPDLVIFGVGGERFGSVLATPLRLGGRAVGTVEVYGKRPREWTREHFEIIEWVAAQCGLIFQSRQLQLELRRSNARLDELVRERTTALQASLNELEHFSYTITHDLRAPLRAMQGFAAILRENCADRLDPESQRHLNRIGAAAERMDKLITDALSYSRAVREEMPLQPIEPGPLLRGIIESYPVFQAPRADVSIVGELPKVLANEAGLTQCFSNLLGNAVKFVRKGEIPKVAVRAEQRDGHVRLWIEDNGIGIAPDMQRRVFEMFQRGSKEYEGNGVGLALVKKVSVRMGGECGFESTLGIGSRFWLELRRAP